jgi:aryl-alcohol dehydrogenase-like predicted oxidoreductase
MSTYVSRREFLKSSALAAAACSVTAPYLACGKVSVGRPVTRLLGRTGLEVTTFGLGGQASLQWTPGGIDPVEIIVKAVESGVNYLDTSNVYGPSQEYFGKAFRALGLVPGRGNYDETRRRSIYLASKTMVRHAKGSHPEVGEYTQGAAGSRAVGDIRRTLSQIFGDGQGNYPQDSYIDLFQIHNLNTLAEADAIFLGLDDPNPEAERIGALAALVDFRDGTNRTGLNPNSEKLIRHIGISGHYSSPVMMECLQRDEQGVIEAMLIAINANDRRYQSHQHNAIPVARAKNVGIIAMKVFADGAMYTKDPRWSQTPDDVVQTVGSSELPSRPLVEYALATPGIATAIIGIGRTDSDGRSCQLEQNLSASQVREDSFSQGDLAEIERLGLRARGGRTNWFQVPQEALGAPRDAGLKTENRDGTRLVRLHWQTAFAADEPIIHYEIRRDDEVIGRVEHRPQTSKDPFTFEDLHPAAERHSYQVTTVDRANRSAAGSLLEANFT